MVLQAPEFALRIAPAGPQRVRAKGLIAVTYGDGRTRLAELHQDGAARIRMPRAIGRSLEAILINTAGGLTGGDRVGWHVETGRNTFLVVTTQACEKIYRAQEDRAEISCKLIVRPGSRLSWLPQETILFDRSALARTIDAEIAGDGELLIVEACLFGRRAMGETPSTLALHDRWRVRHDGRLVHAEDFALGPAAAAALASPAVAGGAVAVASIVMVAPGAAQVLPALRSLLAPSDGASFVGIGATGKLLARFVAEDGLALRKRLVPVIELLNKGAAMPKVWAL